MRRSLLDTLVNQHGVLLSHDPLLNQHGVLLSHDPLLSQHRVLLSHDPLPTLFGSAECLAQWQQEHMCLCGWAMSPSGWVCGSLTLAFACCTRGHVMPLTLIGAAECFAEWRRDRNGCGFCLLQPMRA